nr:hypothetical protein [uncultured Mediterranean phage uvMED]
MLLDDNFEMQGGVRNYLGTTEEVTAPKYWKSSKDSPKTELAYITEAEKGLLLDANLHGSLKDGKANVGASGLLSYDGFGSTDPGQNRAGGDVSGSMDRGGDDSGQQSSGGGSTDAFQGTQSNQYNTAMSEAQQERVVAQNVVDLVDQGVNINDALTGKTTFERLTSTPFLTLNVLKEITSPFANAANKKRRNNYMTTAEIKAYELGTGLNWNPDAVIVEGSPEYNYLFNETDYRSTLGDNNTNQGGGGENNNVVLFDNPEDVKTIETNENSMVNDYFKNIGSNLGVSSAYMDTYNDAKTKIANTLNLTSNNNQYGYGNIANDNFARSMTSANPFFDELTNQGLI